MSALRLRRPWLWIGAAVVGVIAIAALALTGSDPLLTRLLAGRDHTWAGMQGARRMARRPRPQLPAL